MLICWYRIELQWRHNPDQVRATTDPRNQRFPQASSSPFLSPMKYPLRFFTDRELRLDPTVNANASKFRYLYRFVLQVDLLHLLRNASVPGCPVGDPCLQFASYRGLLLSFAVELYLADIHRNHALTGQRWSQASNEVCAFVLLFLILQLEHPTKKWGTEVNFSFWRSAAEW